MVGIFDIIGTIASGWLTDRFDPRYLLVGYYFFRGIGLAILPLLLDDSVNPPMLLFIVIYGLDWVATVPPTAVLCRQAFGDQGTIVFGWVFASHQVGAAFAAVGAGAIRDATGEYTIAWMIAAALCVVAAAMSFDHQQEPRPRAKLTCATCPENGLNSAQSKTPSPTLWTSVPACRILGPR